MKNKIIKKDIESNYIVIIISSIAIILLTLVLTQGYPKFVDQFPNIVLYISVLAGILLGLLTLTLLVYFIINNFYTDKHFGYIKDIKSTRKYLYYRISYVYFILFYFIILALATIVISSSVTWMDIYDFIYLETVVVFLNILLVYFCFFMASYYKTRYNLRIPKSVIVSSILLIISLLTTLYVGLTSEFSYVIINTMISYLLVVFVILTNINKFKTSKFFINIVEVVLIIIILCLGGVGFYFAYQDQVYFENQYDDKGTIASEEESTFEYIDEFDYKVYTQKETIYGDMLITNSNTFIEGSEQNGLYSVYINGEKDISAEVTTTAAYITVIDPTTNEKIDYSYDEDYNYLYVTSNLINSDGTKINICSIEVTEGSTTKAKEALKESTCLTEEQTNEITELATFIQSEIDLIKEEEL